MLDLVFAVLAAGLQAAGGQAENTPAITEPQTAQVAPEAAPQVASPNVSIGAGVLLNGVPVTTAPVIAAQEAASVSNSAEFNMAVVPPGLVADPQEPTGKFTTAGEVKPILQATKGNWVAVREYDGRDLVYVTHLWAWRCGLHAMAISVNGEPMQNWPLPECHMKYQAPGAILEEDGQPYLRMRLGSVETITIQIVYDDLSMDIARFERGNVLIP